LIAQNAKAGSNPKGFGLLPAFFGRASLLQIPPWSSPLNTPKSYGFKPVILMMSKRKWSKEEQLAIGQRETGGC